MIKTYSLSLLCLSTITSAAFASDSWIESADAFTAQKNIPDKWEIQEGQLNAIKLNTVLKELPNPDQWSDLRSSYTAHLESKKKVQAGERLMQLLLAYLDGDHLAVQKLGEALREQKDLRHLDYQLKDLLIALNKTVYAKKSEAQVDQFIEELKDLSSPTEDTADQSNSLLDLIFSNDFDYTPYIDVPDLVTLEGEAVATDRLLEALKKKAFLQINNADATLRLAQELALENIDELGAAQWALTHEIGQWELYEAMNAKFPLKGDLDDDYSRASAAGYYFWSLVVAGRSEEAIQTIRKTPGLVEELPYEALNQLKKAGYSREVWDFLDQLLLKYPQVDLWDNYIALSAELEESERMLEVIEKSFKITSKNDARRVEKLTTLSSGYLGIGETESAVKWLIEAIEIESRNDDVNEEQLSAAIQLAEIGLLLNNKEWLERGVSEAEAIIDAKPLASDYGYVYLYSHMNLVQLYLRLNKTDQATQLLHSLLILLNEEGRKEVAKNLKAKGRDSFHYSGDIESLPAFRKQNDDAYRSILSALVGIAVKSKNFDKAAYLLNNRTEWATADLSEIIGETDAYLESNKLGLLVAKTLQAQGNNDAASKVLEALLREASGYDPAYALYLEINGAAAVPYFDQLFAIDQFEERPLIWKAQQLINEGKIEAAEVIATKAIAIDPSDGEQPRDDRMRVYDVMRQIRIAQGNTKDANFFAGVLKAIRLSEEADLYYSAGLYTDAIQRYRESLDHFQNAYCVQSRLAVRLYDLGKIDEAIAHYRKAYELMPSSFGRVESHCFGCESVFKGDKPQSIAEEVFTGLLASTPEVPQVHYLIGYLRDYQEKEVEALKHFRDAVALDPDYLNAWKKIASLSERMAMEPDLKDDLILKIYMLDPLGRHSSPSLHEVQDIKLMWLKVLEQRALIASLPKQKVVYPLEAAKKELQQKPISETTSYMYNREIQHPVDVLERNEVVEAINELFIDISKI